MFLRCIKKLAVFCCCLLPLLSVPTCESWGPIGHETVANIAQTLLTPQATNLVQTILPANTNMSAVANWADEIRTLKGWQWTEPLHFINTPAWNCSYIPLRDCFNDQHQFPYCVDGAIHNYTKQIITSSTTLQATIDQQHALKFIIHFVGDIHQPLHCGFTEDRGGNSIKVKFFTEYTNLHAVWDSGIIKQRILDCCAGNTEKWLHLLLEQYLTKSNIQKWSADMYSQDWGQDSVYWACQTSYVEQPGSHIKIKNDAHLSTTYYDNNYPIVEQRLAMAGVRLATLLNRIAQSYN